MQCGDVFMSLVAGGSPVLCMVRYCTLFPFRCGMTAITFLPRSSIAISRSRVMSILHSEYRSGCSSVFGISSGWRCGWLAVWVVLDERGGGALRCNNAMMLFGNGWGCGVICVYV